MAEDKAKVAEVKVDLPEEDLVLKEKLDLLVQRLQDNGEAALDQLEQEVRGATTSMTSIPKPLKFLRAHYETLKLIYEGLPDAPLKTRLANFLSVVALTQVEGREILGFLLKGDINSALNWGHEYVRNLCGEVRDEYLDRLNKEQPRDDLHAVVDLVIPFLVSHGSESDAIDLLAETDSLERLLPFVDCDNYGRICRYVLATAHYAADPDEMYRTLHFCMSAYVKVKKFPEALRVALKLNRPELVQHVMASVDDPTLKKQCCYLLGRQRYNIKVDEGELDSLISNEFLNSAFLRLAKDLDVLEPKVPEDIYKSHLEERPRGMGGSVESAKQNLAATFVNAFVNAGYCNDTLATEEKGSWIYKHRDSDLMSVAASLGMVLLWNVDEGIMKIDKYQYSKEDYIKSGALMAFGMVNAGLRNECDPAFALLTDHLATANDKVRLGIIAGLSLAYAGSARDDVLEVLTPIVIDPSVSLECSALAALGLGMVFVGTCNEDVAQAIAQTLMERTPEELKHSYARFFALGIGLVFLGQQDRVSTVLGVINDLVGEPMKRYAMIVAESCAYAGSGNVLKVQEMMHICAEHLEEKDWAGQSAAVLGFAVIAMGEDIGTDMALRMVEHLLQYSEVNIRRVTPLAIGLLCISNPKVNVVDILSKLTHDNDAEVAQAAIFALGLVGAGTNNARLAGSLRQLAGYYAKEPKQLMMVRIAQGLLHLGKGLMTLQPYHSERWLLSPVALSAILATLHAMLDLNGIIHTNGHFLLFYLVNAVYPRWLVTVDENLEPLPVQVRVGQAVDVVGQAGHPRTITGFQTHTTPVLLSHGERAELATEEYEAVTEILENFVILRPKQAS
jgi:26S proteasome regulatory subunit N1